MRHAMEVSLLKQLKEYASCSAQAAWPHRCALATTAPYAANKRYHAHNRRRQGKDGETRSRVLFLYIHGTFGRSRGAVLLSGSAFRTMRCGSLRQSTLSTMKAEYGAKRNSISP